MTGVYIARVNEGSSADDAGIEEGDVIIVPLTVTASVSSIFAQLNGDFQNLEKSEVQTKLVKCLSKCCLCVPS